MDEEHSVKSNFVLILERCLYSVPEAERPALVAGFQIKSAQAARPKWKNRLRNGGELATLSAPLYMKRVHAADIASDGTVDREAIRAIDPNLMRAVETYVSQRKKRGLELGDASGLKFTPARQAKGHQPLPLAQEL